MPGVTKQTINSLSTQVVHSKSFYDTLYFSNNIRCGQYECLRDMLLGHRPWPLGTSIAQ